MSEDSPSDTSDIASLFPCSIDTPEQMVELGETLAKFLHLGDVVALIGNLGAGKTHLTQGIAKFFQYEEKVTSPTFGLIHEYRPSPLIHADLYRLEHPNELLQIGWEDFLEQDIILIVEWADRFPELFPEQTHWIKITQDGSTRKLEYHCG
ncbi:tRNA (adenosine(37)-N6)-threonylcarbamoyltransferase complex ATPase subunit type 1 TsaE [Akkermansiaceae bacterium]|nr:tRNA (adenosine(37)-N6)-threonylcarbamoyltransferase complex ATPase subunit type 1 TsaE [Akkermansiaceae bacterium]